MHLVLSSGQPPLQQVVRASIHIHPTTYDKYVASLTHMLRRQDLISDRNGLEKRGNAIDQFSPSFR